MSPLARNGLFAAFSPIVLNYLGFKPWGLKSILVSMAIRKQMVWLDKPLFRQLRSSYWFLEFDFLTLPPVLSLVIHVNKTLLGSYCVEGIRFCRSYRAHRRSGHMLPEGVQEFLNTWAERGTGILPKAHTAGSLQTDKEADRLSLVKKRHAHPGRDVSINL